MRIGVLTFHCEINYGAVLQCYALQTALTEMGHDVFVIDRWWDDDNVGLERGYKKWGALRWLKFIVRSLLGLGDFGLWMRCRRTKKFIADYLHLTPYHFVEWENAPDDLGLDLIVVGSDQVWHCGDWGNPRAYLLDGARKKSLPPAIAYAASFGMRSIPSSYVDLFKLRLPDFRTISCREREGAGICSDLGVEAFHVADPSLLISKERWCDLVHLPAELSGRVVDNKLICYFMSVDVAASIPLLQAFAKKNDCEITVFSNDGSLFVPPKSLNDFRLVYGNNRVKLYRSGGPLDFVHAFATAKWVITDSYHALMFSAIFDCNVRFIRPSNAERSIMFARIEEFRDRFVVGDLIEDTVGSALESIDNGRQMTFDKKGINEFRQTSRRWLQRAVSI